MTVSITVFPFDQVAIYNTCSTCNNPMTELLYSKEIVCKYCGNCYHAKRNCLKIPNDQIDSLRDDTFICYQCVENSLPFNSLTDADFNNAIGKNLNKINVDK